MEDFPGSIYRPQAEIQLAILDDKAWQQLVFCWGYDRLARFCDLRGIPYPAIDENGDIDDPKGEWRELAKSLEQ